MTQSTEGKGLVAICTGLMSCQFPGCPCEVIEDRRLCSRNRQALAARVAQVEQDVRREMAAGCRAEDCRATEYQTLLEIFELLRVTRNSRPGCREDKQGDCMK